MSWRSRADTLGPGAGTVNTHGQTWRPKEVSFVYYGRHENNNKYARRITLTVLIDTRIIVGRDILEITR